MMDPMENRVYNIWSKYAGEKNNLVHDQVNYMSTAHGRNVELESLLSCEKQRSAQYEVNIETLQNEYSKLKEENQRLYSEMDKLCVACDNTVSVYKNMLAKANEEAKAIEEKYELKSEEYEQHLKGSQDNSQMLKEQFMMQVKDLKSEIGQVILIANQNAQQYDMKEQELKVAKEESAVYIKRAEEQLGTEIEQFQRTAEQALQKKNEELQAELNKAVNMSTEKSYLQMHVKSLSDEVEQLSHEKNSFTHQLTWVETELQKTLAEQRVVITALHGEKQLLESRLKDRINFSEQLKAEKFKLELEINACHIEINSLCAIIQGLTNHDQVDQHRIQLQVDILKNTLKYQDEMFRTMFYNEKVMQDRVVNDLLHKNELLYKANQELLDLSKKTEASKDMVIEDLESKIMKLEAGLEDEAAETPKLQQLLENKELECTRNKIDLANEMKINMELRKFLTDSQQLVEACNQNEEMSHILTQIRDKNDVEVNNLTKLLEANQQVCENLKLRLLTEKEESRKLIEDMTQYENMRHCKHNEEMLQLMAKIRDLKLQLNIQSGKSSSSEDLEKHIFFSEDLPGQANSPSDIMPVNSD